MSEVIINLDNSVLVVMRNGANVNPCDFYSWYELGIDLTDEILLICKVKPPNRVLIMMNQPVILPPKPNN